jgi:hypothetical protein
LLRIVIVLLSSLSLDSAAPAEPRANPNETKPADAFAPTDLVPSFKRTSRAIAAVAVTVSNSRPINRP